MTEWYKLFNPRQLLTLVKLVKLIREVGKQIEQEKVKEGLSKEESFEYTEE
jgi:putative DNA methylase